MKIILKNDKVIATHGDGQEIDDLYPAADRVMIVRDVMEISEDGTPSLTIDDYRLNKQAEIRAALESAEYVPVTVSGSVWHGNYLSCQKLDAGRRLAIEAGLTEITFFDAANAGHTLTLAEAKTICLTLGQNYQTLFAQKQAKMTAIDAAATIEAIEAITW